ncbi:unnamed protein product [Lymnaea stagnalis]|uniref:Transmembrane protein 62 n=1 Tax=Lymnaea stagnalis TaxID=6523 RepID=A0AAV2HTM3_LYMST
MQIRDEWIQYEQIIKRCRSLNKAKWLDLRGNHDSFNVLNFESENNFYRFHSGKNVQTADDHHGTYLYQHELPFGTYSFIVMDACSKPGLHRPFNFFGYLDDAQIQYIKTLAALTKSSNQTIWLGHYPTSLIVHDPPALRQIMSNSIAYLCGHLHTMMGYVPKMYSRHKTGQLELELGDWKENRVYRLLAMDHDLLSFTDAKLGDWPLAVITNPKSNMLYSPRVEPLHLIESSTHIRILAFSPTGIKGVTVSIDDRPREEALQAGAGQPLYVLGWQPEKYSHGIHTIRVQVLDEAGKNVTISQTFSVDGTEKQFEFLPRLILMLNIYTMAKLTFGILVFLYTFILTSIRQSTCIRHYYLKGNDIQNMAFNSALMKIWLAARSNVSYFILIGSVLYLTFGPWFVANLITNELGVVFVWGIIIHGSFIPGGLTFFYGIFQFITFTVPLTVLLGHLLDMRRMNGSRSSVFKHPTVLLPSLVLFAFTAHLALTEFPNAYGVEALIYGPLRTGNVILLPAALWLASRADLRKILAVNEPA